MAKVGSKLLRVDEDEPRYGIELRLALEPGSMNRINFAGHLRLTDEETALLLDGRASASLSGQQLVAACWRWIVRESSPTRRWTA